MADIYCSTLLTDYTPLECGVEKGRIIALGLVDPDSPLTDPSDNTEWTAGLGSPQTAWVITSGVRGEMPRATDTEEEGFGLDETQLTGASHQATLQILGVKNNPAFWNIVNKKQWHVALAYSEGDMFYIAKPVTVISRPVVGSDLKSTIYNEVTIKWSDIDNPLVYTTPASLTVS